jgi:hypothetical protein
MMMGVDLAGSDIANFALPNGNPQLCQQACNARGDCRAWTFMKIGVHGPQATCWIKNAVPAGRYHDGVVSGIRSGGGGDVGGPVVGATALDISGYWRSTYNDLTYNVIQQGNRFGWTMPQLSQTAQGTIDGDRLSVSWDGGNTGSTTGRITTDGNGRANRIEFANGVVFVR